MRTRDIRFNVFIIITLLMTLLGSSGFLAQPVQAAAAASPANTANNTSGEEKHEGTPHHPRRQDPNVKQPGAKIGATGANAAALNGSGYVLGWGYNCDGQVGINDEDCDDVSAPTQVYGLSDATGVAAGEDHSLAVTATGAVYAWGDNCEGQVGVDDYNCSDYLVPVRVVGPGPAPSTNPEYDHGTNLGYLEGIVAVAAGYYHSLALAADGSVYAWGSNCDGQLGIGTDYCVDVHYPVRVVGPDTDNDGAPNGFLTGIVSIAAGQDHSLAVRNDGAVFAWGYNGYGQLGNGTYDSSFFPVQVVSSASEPQPSTPPTTFLNVGVGPTVMVAATSDSDYSLVLAANGEVFAWGANYDGQLGIGDLSHSEWLTPQRVAAPGPDPSPTPSASPTPGAAPGAGLTGVTYIAAGEYHGMAVVNNDTVYTWGYNCAGQLGIGIVDCSEEEDENYQYEVPQQMVGPNNVGFFTGAAKVAGGYEFSLVLKQDGTVYSMGDNSDGELGIGQEEGEEYPYPVPVRDPRGAAILGGVSAIAAGDEHALAVGVGIAATTPASLTFNPQQIGTTSAPQQVTIVNTGAGPLTIGAATIGGTNPNDFIISSNSCAGSLAPGQGCTVGVSSTPSATGARAATLTVATISGAQTVSLNGTGTNDPTNIRYAVTASANGAGTVTPAGTSTYTGGTTATFTAAANSGQTFTGWTLNGEYVGFSSTLAFTVSTNTTLVATFVATPTFSDLGGLSPQDRQAITFLAALGIVNPAGVNGSGQFEPANDVKRAEVAAFIARVFGWQREFHANRFPDKCDPQGQNCVDDELWNNVAALADYGVVGGYEDKTTCDSADTTAPCYLPRDTVQRVQVVSVVARAFILQPDQRPTGFWNRQDAAASQYTDVSDTGTQRSDLATYRANVGTIPGQVSDGTFGNPSGNGSRLYVVQVLYAAFSTQFGADRVP